MRKPSPTDSRTRHQDFVDEILSGYRSRVAEAVREHLEVGKQRTLEVLEPYFRLRRANGKRFYRKDKNLQPIDASAKTH